ncbi:hypothetical protein HDV57DRAFT_132683 [Trichoderma longibrachiatum]|uniref:Uncharacterized protein n=1 Tax=Trichoderma longibrachiatum ATCC 18648 TaxID=983965 RepID=A0A2T4BRY4_TRILO|nr:hypothetical protein M440DRAFT_1098376 [Trichoderma longibrachiatum ATCC 18648]
MACTGGCSSIASFSACHRVPEAWTSFQPPRATARESHPSDPRPILSPTAKGMMSGLLGKAGHSPKSGGLEQTILQGQRLGHAVRSQGYRTSQTESRYAALPTMLYGIWGMLLRSLPTLLLREASSPVTLHCQSQRRVHLQSCLTTAGQLTSCSLTRKPANGHDVDPAQPLTTNCVSNLLGEAARTEMALRNSKRGAWSLAYLSSSLTPSSVSHVCLDSA